MACGGGLGMQGSKRKSQQSSPFPHSATQITFPRGLLHPLEGEEISQPPGNYTQMSGGQDRRGLDTLEKNISALGDRKDKSELLGDERGLYNTLGHQ